METFIDFANLSLHWLDSGLTIVSSWVLLCMLAIANGIFFALENATSIASTSGQWLLSTLRWLSNPNNAIADFFLITSIMLPVLMDLIDSQRDSK